MIKVKDIFSSRYGAKGVIIQADNSQLELRVLAYMSQDPTLIQEYIDGADIHLNNAREWKKDSTIDKKTPEGYKIRTAAKAMSFQLTYGAGAAKMSKTLGISLEEAKEFISSFYEKYSRVKEWHTEIIDEVRNNQQGEWSYLQGPSGRIWWFQEKPTELEYLNKKGIFKSINPAQVKDLPIQGTASDIVIIQRAKLVRKLLSHSEDCCIVNTVHDSVVLDCKKDILEDIISIVKDTMEDVTTINRVFTKEFNVPLLVDISYGENWGSLKEV